MGRLPKPFSRRDQELHIQSSFIDAARERGAAAYKVAAQSRRGFPDVLLVYKGRVTFVELKQRVGKLSKLQEFCHRELTARGAEVVVIYGRQCAFEFLDVFFRA